MFIGFAIGTICLIGLARAVARRRWHPRFYGPFHPYAGYAYGFGGHHQGFGRHRGGYGRSGGACDNGPGDEAPWDDSPPWRGRRESRWGRGHQMIDSILGRLEATPEQAKIIEEAIEELKDKGRELRGIASDVRSEVARAVRGAMLDDVALEGATTRIDDASLKMRAAVRATIAKVHQVLDDRQRKMLANMIESSWRGRW